MVSSWISPNAPKGFNSGIAGRDLFATVCIAAVDAHLLFVGRRITGI